MNEKKQEVLMMFVGATEFIVENEENLSKKRIIEILREQISKVDQAEKL